ncbi:MAG: NUDIX hydrolase [Candidatus Eremiobacteraeota bacterium]|nr:NUDIX hydrolase [Candidatus Eremiobacteraeota bacterium]
MEKPQWRIRSRTMVIDSPFLKLRRDEIELPDGKRIPDYFVRESSGFVIVFALTDDERVVVVYQYRYGIDRITLELPAGAMEDEEHPLLCAKRELIEETGFTSDNWEELLVAPSDPVRSNSVMHAYLVRGVKCTHEQDLDEGEEVEFALMPLEEFKLQLRRGEIGAVPSIAVAYAALERLGRL